jgi:hypothetical protein
MRFFKRSARSVSESLSHSPRLGADGPAQGRHVPGNGAATYQGDMEKAIAHYWGMIASELHKQANAA